MGETIIFDVNNQANITYAACDLCVEIEKSMPRVPWLNNTKQQEAFKQTVAMISNGAEKLSADQDAKNAIVFWTLVLLLSNKKPFQLATASVKNWGTYGLSPVVSTFISWLDTNIHPGQVVAESFESWRN